MSGLVYDLDEHVYHARPELSSTQARRILDSPARFHYQQTHPEPAKVAFDLGTAVHTKVLGTGSRAIAYPADHLTPSGNVSTKIATVEWAAEQRAKGLTPVTPDQLAAVDQMAEAVLKNDTARALLELPGQREVSAFATVDGVECRARLDLTVEHPTGLLGVDLKTTGKSADMESFARAVLNYGYDVQEAHYDDVYGAAAEEPLEGFVFIVVETAPPHLTAVHQLDVIFRDMGHKKARRARELYAECTASGVWPGHPHDIQLCSPPTWAAIQFEEQYDEEMKL